MPESMYSKEVPKNAHRNAVPNSVAQRNMGTNLSVVLTSNSSIDYLSGSSNYLTVCEISFVW